MRSLTRLFAVVTFVAALSGAQAADYVDQSAVDELFAQLKHAASAEEANELTQEIWTFWLHPDVAALDRRMTRASALVQQGDLPQALSSFSSIVRDFPDYAEGWNQRATVYFLMNDFKHALGDIEKVLAIEPRHFGALSGRAMIYLRQGRRDDALHDISTAVSINPFLDEKRLFPELAPPVTYI